MVLFAQCNVRSINTSRNFIEDIAVINKIDCFLLTEIWHPDFDKMNLLNKWTWYKSEREEQQGGGAGIVINPNTKATPRNDLNVVGLEAVWCEVYINDISYLIGSVYVKPNDLININKLIELMTRINHNKIIITGDLNAKHQAWFNSDNNLLGKTLNDYLIISDYNIVNNKSPTYKNRIIDLTITKGCNDKILSWDTFPDIFINSDHNLIGFTVGYQNPSLMHKRWRISSTDWKRWEEITEERFRRVMTTLTDNMDIDEVYEVIKTEIINIANEEIGKCNKDRKHKSWWSNEIKNLHREVNDRKKTFKRRSTQNNLNKYLRSKEIFYTRYCEERNKYFNEVLINNASNDKNLWKIIKSNTVMPRSCVQPIIVDAANIKHKDTDIADEFIKTYGNKEIKIDAAKSNEIRTKAMQYLLEEDQENLLNEQFTRDELMMALASLNKNAAVSPAEDIHTLMLVKGGKALHDVLLMLANLSLNQKKFPKECKKDHKNITKKMFRENYNNCKAYRPLSLESVIGKMIEYMIKNRVEWYSEVNNNYSNTQEAYRKDHNCNDLVLRIVQNIQEGWNDGKTTALLVFDFENYFEMIWNKLLVCKLYESGIKGNILNLLNDYIEERCIRFNINDHTTDWIKAKIGTPQGSVLSTLNTNYYSKDSDNTPDEKHGEYVDDNCKWEADIDEVVAVNKIQNRLDELIAWCDDNNIAFSADKIKLLVFRPPLSPRPFRQNKITVLNEDITESDACKILGTHMDNELKFDIHFDKVCKSAFSAIQHIKVFAGTNKQYSQHNLILLYKSLVRSKLDYSIAALSNISDHDLKLMKSVQRCGLLLATKCLPQTADESLNLMCNTIPIDIHIKKRMAENLVRIASKSTAINKKYKNWSEIERKPTHPITTFSKMEMAYKQLNREKCNLPLVNQMYHDLIPPWRKSDIIIPSKDNKDEQIQFVRETITNNTYNIIISCDGSSFPDKDSSLGKTGAAAVILFNGTKHVKQVLISSKSNNYDAELAGILAGLEYVHYEQNTMNMSILVLCDCVSAIQYAFSSAITADYNVKQIKIRNIYKLLSSNNVVKCTWAPGHTGIDLNEEADREAKRAAQLSSNESTPERKISLIKIKENTIKKSWQFRIDQDLSTKRIYMINKKAGSWSIHKINNSLMSTVNRLATGHHYLNASRSNVTGCSELCDCGEPETFHHFMYHCELYTRYRIMLLNNINRITQVYNASLVHIPIDLLFGQAKDEDSKKKNTEVLKAFLKYLQCTNRFN